MLKVQALTRRRGTCVVWALGTLVTGEIFVVLSNEGWGGSAALLPSLHILCWTWINHHTSDFSWGVLGNCMQT